MKTKKKGAAAALLALVGVLTITALPAELAHAYDGKTLDTGIYWFGKGNISQKAVAGVTNPYYSATKPTVIYVHGWQKDSTPKLKRETFNYLANDATNGVNVNTADAWINAGWNVGIFYWNQLADEGEVKDAEAKIWSTAGPQGMRWRDVYGTYNSGPSKPAADLMVDAYASAMNSYTGTNVRIVGHSLGNQMATRFTKLVSDRVTAGTLKSNLLPKRVALLDPFWSKDGKTYLGGKWTGEVAREHVTALKAKGVVFEQYNSSAINDLWIGDANTGMQQMTALTDLAPWWCSSIDQVGKHVAAPNWYFYSFYTAAPEEVTVDLLGNRKLTGKVAASAATSDARIKEMMLDSTKKWVQVEGRYTQDPSDDQFEYKNK